MSANPFQRRGRIGNSRFLRGIRANVVTLLSIVAVAGSVAGLLLPELAGHASVLGAESRCTSPAGQFLQVFDPGAAAACGRVHDLCVFYLVVLSAAVFLIMIDLSRKGPRPR